MQSDALTASLAAIDRELIAKSIRDLHLLRAQEQFDAFDRYLSPTAVFELVGKRSQFPYAGTYTGKGEIIGLYKRVNTEIETIDSKLVDLMIDGANAFSRRLVHVRHRGTGLCENHEIWDIWKFRDGLVQNSLKMIDISAYERLQG